MGWDGCKEGRRAAVKVDGGRRSDGMKTWRGGIGTGGMYCKEGYYSSRYSRSSPEVPHQAKAIESCTLHQDTGGEGKGIIGLAVRANGQYD